MVWAYKESSLRYHQGYPNIYFHDPLSSLQVADNFIQLLEKFLAILLLPPCLNTVEFLVVIQEHSNTNSSLPCTGFWKYMPPLQPWKAEETATIPRCHPSQPPSYTTSTWAMSLSSGASKEAERDTHRHWQCLCWSLISINLGKNSQDLGVEICA